MPGPAAYLADVAQAISIKYNNLVYELKAGGADIIVMSLGEAFFDIPLYSFEDLPFPDVYHYSHSRGVPDLRRQLAAYYRDQYRVPTDSEREIIVTAGSKLAIHMAFMAVLDPGDEVLIHEPAWVSYTQQVKLCHGVPVTVPHDRSVFELGGYVTSRTRAIVLNYPHNPRGAVLSLQEMESLHGLARARNLFLIADEAYSDFVAPGLFRSIAEFDPGKEHTIVCNSMSKNYGMSGWRIGYAIARPDMTDQILKINQHLVTCPATILQLYLSKHFEDVLRITKPQIADVVRRRAELARYMDEIGLRYLPGLAAFYFFVSIGGSRLRSDEFCTVLLRERGVSAVPGIGYGDSCDGFIRLSVGTEPMERLKQGVRTIQALITETTDATTIGSAATI
jgi:aspartate aminotransferase/aminotransferase